MGWGINSPTLFFLIISYYSRAMNIKLYRTEPVEILFGPTDTQISFDDYAMLRNAPIWGMELFTANTIPVSPLSQKAILPLANMQNAFITIYETTVTNAWGQFINQHPVLNFNRTVNADADPYVYDFPRMAGQIIQWQKSFIRLTSAIGGGTTYSIYFQVWYSDPVASNQ